MIMIICTIIGHLNLAVYKVNCGVESCVFYTGKAGNLKKKGRILPLFQRLIF